MSFRARLTTFFVLIVIVPMVGVGLLVFSLINASEQGKADARVSGVAVAADGLYRSDAATARARAAALAHDAGLLRGTSLRPRLTAVAAQAASRAWLSGAAPASSPTSATATRSRPAAPG